MDWISLIAPVAASLAGSTTVAALVTVIRNAVSSARQQRVVKDANPQFAIESDRLSVLGRFFITDLGSTSISAYVNNEALKKDFRTKFDAVIEYLGPELSEQEIGRARPVIDRPTTGRAPSSNPNIRAAYESLAAGETWNALARIRRAVEIELRKIVGAHPDERPRKMAAGQLLAIAARLGLLTPGDVERLRYALNTANSAVHGDDVDPYVAVSAIEIAQDFLDSRAAEEGKN